MLRALCQKPYKYSSLGDTYKKIFNKIEHFQSASNECFNARRSELYSCCRCSGAYLSCHNAFYKHYSKQPHLGNMQRSLLQSSLNPKKLSELVQLTNIDLKKASVEFWKIQMVDLKEAPAPAFWLGALGLVPIALPPTLAFLFGYSQMLSSGQYIYSAVLLSSMGGIKWGSVIRAKEQITWENCRLTAVPCMIGLVALIFPKFLGYLLLIFGYLSAFIIDLATSNYPKWFIAQRGVLTNFSVFFLTLAMIQFILH